MVDFSPIHAKVQGKHFWDAVQFLKTCTNTQVCEQNKKPSNRVKASSFIDELIELHY